jgi:uncharacterized DUF497 family protein
VEFEWDERKAAANEAKHGVPFAFGARVFDDPARVEFDVTHESDREKPTQMRGPHLRQALRSRVSHARRPLSHHLGTPRQQS